MSPLVHRIRALLPTAGIGTAALVAFAAAAAAAGIGRSVLTSYLPVLLDRVESEPGVIGTALLVNAAAGFVVPLAVGIWSDRRGLRLPFLWVGVAITVLGLVGVALGTGSSILVLAALGGVAYVGINAITTAHRALVPDQFSMDDRPSATGTQEAMMMAATLVGVIIGGVTVEIADWAPFVVAAVLVPFLALPTLRSVKETGRPVEKAGPERGGVRRAAVYYAHASARPGVRSLLAAQLLWVLGYAATPAFFVLYAEKVLGLSAATASLFLGGFGIATGVAMLWAGRVRDPKRFAPLLGLGVVLMSAGFLGVAASGDNLLLMSPALIAGAVGFGLLSTLGFPLLTTMVPKGEEGGYTALYYSVRSIASAVALPAAGWMISWTDSYRTLFWAGGAATLLALLPLGNAIRAARPRARRAPRVRLPALVRPSAAWAGRWTRSVLAVWGTVVVAGIVLLETPLARLDEELFVAVDGLGQWPAWLFEALDPHTRNYAILVIGGLVAALLFRRRALAAIAGMFVVADLLAGGLLLAVKPIFDRARPQELLDVGTAGSDWTALVSFPSGHMVVTTALAGVIMLVFPRARGLLWAYVIAIGFSRVWFGAHFPLDVLAGAFIGYASARAAYALALRTALLDGDRGPYEHHLEADPAEVEQWAGPQLRAS